MLENGDDRRHEVGISNRPDVKAKDVPTANLRSRVYVSIHDETIRPGTLLAAAEGYSSAPFVD
ncbi:hypothetical protein K2X89_18265 [Myxococcota bacterium]|nr:hypothetical protein [Myxococcota bacterium]